MDGVKV